MESQTTHSTTIGENSLPTRRRYALISPLVRSYLTLCTVGQKYKTQAAQLVRRPHTPLATSLTPRVYRIRTLNRTRPSRASVPSPGVGGWAVDPLGEAAGYAGGRGVCVHGERGTV